MTLVGSWRGTFSTSLSYSMISQVNKILVNVKIHLPVHSVCLVDEIILEHSRLHNTPIVLTCISGTRWVLKMHNFVIFAPKNIDLIFMQGVLSLFSYLVTYVSSLISDTHLTVLYFLGVIKVGKPP